MCTTGEQKHDLFLKHLKLSVARCQLSQCLQFQTVYFSWDRFCQMGLLQFCPVLHFDVYNFFSDITVVVETKCKLLDVQRQNANV